MKKGLTLLGMAYIILVSGVLSAFFPIVAGITGLVLGNLAGSHWYALAWGALVFFLIRWVRTSVSLILDPYTPGFLPSRLFYSGYDPPDVYTVHGESDIIIAPKKD